MKAKPKTKICIDCKEELPLDKFGKDKNNKTDRRTSRCKKCRNIINKTRYQANIIRQNAKNEEKRKPPKARRDKHGHIIPIVVSKYIYIDPKTRPKGSLRKGCPNCRRHIWLLPTQETVICVKCGHLHKVKFKLKAFEKMCPDAIVLVDITSKITDNSGPEVESTTSLTIQDSSWVTA